MFLTDRIERADDALRIARVRLNHARSASRSTPADLSLREAASNGEAAVMRAETALSEMRFESEQDQWIADAQAYRVPVDHRLVELADGDHYALARMSLRQS